MSTYTGLYVQRHANGTIYGIQVTDTFGHQTFLPADEYVRRDVQPPMETLPSQDEYHKKTRQS